MNQPTLVEQPCPKCGTTVQIVPQAGLGVCTKCYAQVPYAAAGAAASGSAASGSYASGSTAPGSLGGTSQPTPSLSDMMSNPAGAATALGKRFGTIGLVAAALLIAAAGLGYKYVKTHYLGSGSGKAGYGGLGLDTGALEADKLAPSVEKLAQRWRKDAVLWEIQVLGLRNDGTVDLAAGGTHVTYISPEKVQGSTKKLREDAIKKFHFSQKEVDYSKKWNAMNKWEGVSAPPIPTCTLKQLGAKLGEAGLAKGESVHVAFDPQWGLDWRVHSEAKKALEGTYSAQDCSKLPK